jgi:hypothetical protein
MLSGSPQALHSKTFSAPMRLVCTRASLGGSLRRSFGCVLQFGGINRSGPRSESKHIKRSEFAMNAG